MLVLAISGEPELINENLYGLDEPYIGHDSVSILLENGKVIFGIEEERLNTIKHTNISSAQSLHLSLKSHSIQFKDIDLIAYYFSKEWVELFMKKLFLAKP